MESLPRRITALSAAKVRKAIAIPLSITIFSNAFSVSNTLFFALLMVGLHESIINKDIDKTRL